MRLAESLYARLALALLALFLAVGLAFLTIVHFTGVRYQEEVTQALNRELAAHIAAEKPVMARGVISRPALQALFHDMMALNPVIEIYVLDPVGTVLGYAAGPGENVRDKIDVAPIRSFLRGATPFPLYGEDPRAVSGKKVFSAAPLHEAGALTGYVYVILGSQRYDSLAELLQGSYIFKLSTAALGGSLLFAAAVGLLLFAALTRRLRRLTAAVDAYRHADFEKPLVHAPLSGSDEIARLAQSFHAMAARLADQLRRLKETDRQRRELVANVSHDLRTPLASMQGYLETLLLKRGDLKPTDELRYLEIAQRHSHKLGRLIDEMFELAKLDALDVQPVREPHALAELISDIVQKFALRAQTAGVRLDTALAHDAPLVAADIALMERVFDNLLENALRHTPRGGAVRMELAAEGRYVTVRVCDTGAGIAADKLPHVFERLYSTRPQHTGSGLGLAIVKKILDLHDAAIHVESRLGAGTTFWFRLRAVAGV